MGIYVECEGGGRHYEGRILDAVREFAQGSALGPCPTCRKPRKLRVHHEYPLNPNPYDYDVIRAFIPEGDYVKDESEPFVFVMRHKGSKENTLWTPYWTLNRRKEMAWGQYPALIGEKSWRAILDKVPPFLPG